jgi:hypothetical protein
VYVRAVVMAHLFADSRPRHSAEVEEAHAAVPKVVRAERGHARGARAQVTGPVRPGSVRRARPRW